LRHLQLDVLVPQLAAILAHKQVHLSHTPHTPMSRGHLRAANRALLRLLGLFCGTTHPCHGASSHRIPLYALSPKPYTLYPIPCTLDPTRYTVTPKAVPISKHLISTHRISLKHLIIKQHHHLMLLKHSPPRAFTASRTSTSIDRIWQAVKILPYLGSRVEGF